MAANIDFVSSSFKAAFSSSFKAASKSLQLACDLLSICLRHVHASLRPRLQPGLQLQAC